MKFNANLKDLFQVVTYTSVDGLAVESVSSELGGEDLLEVALVDGSLLRFVDTDVEVCDATGTTTLKAVDDDEEDPPWVLTFLMSRPISLMDVQSTIIN